MIRGPLARCRSSSNIIEVLLLREILVIFLTSARSGGSEVLLTLQPRAIMAHTTGIWKMRMAAISFPLYLNAIFLSTEGQLIFSLLPVPLVDIFDACVVYVSGGNVTIGLPMTLGIS